MADEQASNLPEGAVHVDDFEPAIVPDEHAQSLGLTTITPVSEVPKPEGYTPFSASPANIAYDDEQAKLLHDKLNSVVGEPTAEEYVRAIAGGDQTLHQQIENASNLAAGTMGTIGRAPILTTEEILAAKGIPEAASAAEKLQVVKPYGPNNVIVQPTLQQLKESAGQFGKIIGPNGMPAKPFAEGGEAVPEGAIPLDKFKSAPTITSDSIPVDQFQSAEDYYGQPGQQLKAGLEGAAQGALGPLAASIEQKLGVNPEEIRARAEANPITHAAGETIGFGGSLLTGEGLAPIVTKLGKAAETASGLAKSSEALSALKNTTGLGTFAREAELKALESAAKINKIAASGVRVGTEMAALQASDELSDMINKDPNQSLGSAAVNIGLSGLIGGAGGAALGAVSPLFESSLQKTKLPDLIDNAKAQYEFRVKNPDLNTGATNELTSRIMEMDDLRNQMKNIKGEALARVIPAEDSAFTPKINEQIDSIMGKVADRLESAVDSVKTRAAVPYIAEDLQKFESAVRKQGATNLDKFNALNDLKQTLDTYQSFKDSVESTARGQIAQDLNKVIRPSLENAKVWGDAGELQYKLNSAISNSIKAENDLVGKFTAKQLGERIVDPNKVQSYVKQAAASKAGLKTSVVKNYLDHTQELADTIAKLHTEYGLERPLASSLNPTPVLNETLKVPNAGTHLGNWLFENGLANAAGNTAAQGVGGLLGSLVGHPYLGASVGQYVLSPFFKSIAKPLLEGASNAGALKAGLDFVANVAKGQAALTNATKNFFKASSEVLPRSLLPDASSINKLKKSLDYVTVNPENAMNVGGNIDHYFPDHKMATAQMTASAQSYLNSLKPTQQKQMPLDSEAPVSKIAEMTYDRQLGIAQQPLLVLKYAKEGTLMPLDVKTLNTIYPGLHSKIVDLLNQNLIQAKAENIHIPYDVRQSLSLLMGTPLDSTMTQASMQAIIGSVRPVQRQAQAPATKTGASKISVAQMNKVNSMYATPQQALEGNKKE